MCDLLNSGACRASSRPLGNVATRPTLNTLQQTRGMKCWVRRDEKRRRMFAQYEVKRKILKSILYNERLPPEMRMQAMLAQQMLPKDSCRSRIVVRNVKLLI